MNKILKYGVICSLSLATLSMMTSCKDVLNEVVYSELGDENAFVTASDALACVNGIYAPLTGIANRTLGYLNDLPTDVAGMKGVNFETLNENGQDIHEDVILMWNRNYSIISRANIAIYRIEKIEVDLFLAKNSEDLVAAQALKDRYIAEAKALRALAYTMLTETYYKVPLVLDPDTPTASRPPLAEVADIEAQIEKDLTEAIPYLPATYDDPAGDHGRMTQAAAKAFLMKAHMRRAGRDRNNGKDATADWTAARDLAKDILTNYPRYIMVDKLFEGLYDPKSDAALYNNEALFTIKSNPNGNQGASSIGLTYTSWDLDAGWNLINVALQFLWKFDPADKRVQGDVFVSDYPSVYNGAKQQFFNVVPKKMEDAGTLSIEQTDVDGVKYKTTEEIACYTWKYKYAHPLTYNYNCGNNFYVLRKPDVFLCLAECINELSGPTSEAIDAVNTVRQRAFGDANHNLTPEQTGNKDSFRMAICDERAFELHSEGCRRQDLIRMGLWKTVMIDHFNEIKGTVQARERNADIKEPAQAPHDYSSDWKVYPFDLQEKDVRMYYPIPKRESDLNPTYLNNRVF